MRKILFFLLLLTPILFAQAEWKKVYGTNVNNTIVHDMIIHQGSFFAGTNGHLLRSDDKGETWTSLPVNVIGIVSLESDGSRLFAGAIMSLGGSTLIYSDDNGETWNNTNVTQSQVSTIEVINQNLMYAYSNLQVFFQSTDRGETWTQITGLPFTATREIYKSHTGRVFISGYYSDDDGQTWSQTGYDRAGSGIYAYAENQDGLWVGAGKLWLSNDHGGSWEEKDPYLTASLIADGNNIFQGREGFAYSTDGGNSFTSYNEGIDNIDRVLSMIFDGEFILIGLDGPGLYKIKASDLGITTSVEQTEELANSFELLQNYPNPFNPSTTIKFSIPESGFVSLKVYDVLGKEVATLVNNELAAGSYSAIFDANNYSQNLSSGIYFYKLESGNFVQTKKLMLIK